MKAKNFSVKLWISFCLEYVTQACKLHLHYENHNIVFLHTTLNYSEKQKYFQNTPSIWQRHCKMCTQTPQPKKYTP